MSALSNALLLALLAGCAARDASPDLDRTVLALDDGARRVEDAKPAFETVTRRLPDGIAMTADLWRAARKDGARPPLLVCMHAANSSRGEYRSIAPELVARGFDVLAVDLRAGGAGEQGDRRTKQRSGTMNETWRAAMARTGREPTRVEAYADLPTVIAWAKELANGAAAPSIGLVGSSYSASLALVYAAEHAKDVDAVFAFSPGEWIPGWDVASKVKALAVPCFVTCGSNDVDVEQMEKVVRGMERAPDVYSPKAEGRDGLHGAGTLHVRGEEDRAAVWKRFDAALERLRAKTRR